MQTFCIFDVNNSHLMIFKIGYWFLDKYCSDDYDVIEIDANSFEEAVQELKCKQRGIRSSSITDLTKKAPE